VVGAVVRVDPAGGLAVVAAGGLGRGGGALGAEGVGAGGELFVGHARIGPPQASRSLTRGVLQRGRSAGRRVPQK
jgi:hypothetical protein